VGRRTACLALTVLLAAFLAATLVRLAPGFGMDERQLDLRLSSDSIRAIQSEYGASTGVIGYFWSYLSALCRGDLGRSVSLGRPVRELIADRLGVTLQSVAAGLAWAWITAVGAALSLGALRRRVFDFAAMAVSGSLLCLPAAVVGLFSFYLGAGPALAIGAILLPRVFRYIRNITGAIARRPHVRAARARGVGGLGLLARHIWLPAAGEVLALGAVSASMAMGAAIPVEALCDSPGVGQLAWKAALARDLPVLVNITILIATVTAVANLLADAARSAFWTEA
jgi:peptide/nickel transport system permease protein